MKYIYSFILLGILILTGCENQEIKDEKSTAISLNLSNQEKEHYYKEYLEIIEEVNNEYEDADLTLIPIEEFYDEYWVEPEELRKIAIDMVTAVFVPAS